MTALTGWEQPNSEWMPISLGPFHFRRNIDGGPGATGQQIVDWFSKAQWTGQKLRCQLELDGKSGLLRVNLPKALHLGKQYVPSVGFAPAGMHPNNLWNDIIAISGGSATSDDVTNWTTTISSVWGWMESEFMAAVAAKDVRIFARFNDPLAREFSEVPADIFQLFRITDWATGTPAASVAEGPNQTRLYALYCVGAEREPQSEIVTIFERDKAKPTKVLAEPVAAPPSRRKVGAPTTYNWPLIKDEFDRLMDEYSGLIDADPAWRSQADIVRALEDYCDRTKNANGTPSESSLKASVKKWYEDWSATQSITVD